MTLRENPSTKGPALQYSNAPSTLFPPVGGYYVQDAAPTGAADKALWFRTAAPQKWFVRDFAAARWYAAETLTWDSNRNGTMAGGEWLGRHRINALSSSSRGSLWPFAVHWYGLIASSTSTPSIGSSVDFNIGGSDVATVPWDGADAVIPLSVDIVAEALDPHRAEVNFSLGTPPENPQLFAFGREVVV